jgi:hypothetical protein
MPKSKCSITSARRSMYVQVEMSARSLKRRTVVFHLHVASGILSEQRVLLIHGIIRVCDHILDLRVELAKVWADVSLSDVPTCDAVDSQRCEVAAAMREL